ncbi:uncharacterized protein LOC128732458 [Sabethes cyaneus]|uniref:uncharacterized protein LOC128732458 n=1 Tax=Sabethes cyaneus TaxID=53552 RepID=UPI00237E32B2|nr:uncharacterized protein LOC128732458 [Sabethes cyaneus]
MSAVKIRIAQSECYADEVATMNRNVRLPPEYRKALSRSGSIATLSPMLDDRGVLRVDGRIAAADYVKRYEVPDNLASPDHQLATELIPSKISMPWFRTTPFVRPFTFSGIDYFGPYLVKVGCSAVKRWVAIFTCLTVRAIHLQAVHSLTTDSCKKAVRRFVARRGAPKEVYTDNGTNFVGASRELEQELRDINRALGSTFTDIDTLWRFNPPSAPHMGGCVR